MNGDGRAEGQSAPVSLPRETETAAHTARGRAMSRGGSRMTLRVGRVRVEGEGRVVVVWGPRRVVGVARGGAVTYSDRFPPCRCGRPGCPDGGGAAG